MQCGASTAIGANLGEILARLKDILNRIGLDLAAWTQQLECAAGARRCLPRASF
jgi:hypothetical protein